ncbi:hypothetical protein FACS1894164_17170 [Spirochaetia bacterium]|nr:hypothetical protein FACS1894164_17170 [Spirochaetia bacterium]
MFWYEKIHIRIGFLGIATWAFSFESSISLGFEFDNSFDNNNYIGSPGFDLNSCALWGNIGYYINFTLSFPDKIINDVNINNYDYLLQLSLVLHLDIVYMKK